MKQLLNAKQLAAEIGVSTPTILSWHAKAIITAEIKVGRVCRFDLAKVRKQIAAHTQSTVREPEPRKLPHYL